MDRLDQETLRKNEVDANKALAKGSLFLAAALLIIWILYLTGVFEVNPKSFIHINISFPIFIVFLTSSIFYTRGKHIEKPGFKYFLILQFIIVVFVLNCLLPKHTMLGWPLVLILVCHYYNPKVSIIAYVLVVILMLAAIYTCLFYGEWDANLLSASNSITIDGRVIPVDSTLPEERKQWLDYLAANGDNRYFKVFLYYYLPRLVITTLCGSIAFFLTQRSARLLKDEAIQVSINTRMANELQMARDIQTSMLPDVGSEKDEGVAALMDPAKEVGGDFYDYFKIDQNHVALVVGDVSGKGIPGALLMMKTETLLRSLATSLSQDTSLIMKHCNTSLCLNNEAGMFVTCWFGIVDLRDGVLHYTNAGHNNPIIVRNGKAEYMTSKHSVVLGAFEDTNYKEETVKLGKGDKIILYTDGVTEAHNKHQELYGENRLLEFTQNHLDVEPIDFIPSLRKTLNDFADGFEQFDDITLLMFEYRNVLTFSESRIFKADVKELDNLFDYSSTLLDILGFSRKDIIMINTALEEVFVNVAKYAYDGDGTVEVALSNDKNRVTFVFKDRGRQFNPLERQDPNINASSDEREIGGLGIFMAKSIMDEVSYEYKDGQNILTMIKGRR